MTTSATLKFNLLLPQERDQFELPDGSNIPFRNRDEFSPVEREGLVKNQAELARLMTQFEGGKLSGAAMKKAHARLDSLFAVFIRAILPDIPEETLDALQAHPPVRTNLVAWWQNRQAQRVQARQAHLGEALAPLNGAGSPLKGAQRK